MSKRDYYEILGVDRDVDDKTLKTAYRKLAMKYHPDRNPDDKQAEEMFKEASEAYEVLSDPTKRQRYNQFGHDGMRRGQDFHDFSSVNDIFDIFGRQGGGGGSIFEEFFGFGGGGGRQRGGQGGGERGKDLRIKLELSLEEIAEGVEKTLKYKRLTECDTCSGSGAKPGSGSSTCGTCGGQGRVQQVSRSVFGQFVNVTTCSTCNGSGQVIKDPCGKCKGEGRQKGDTTVKVNIPAGVSDGNYIPIPGKGHAGKHGGRAGDLIVVVAEKEHPLFMRDGDNVLFDLTISYPDAALGGEVEVPTLHGESILTIEAGTQPGTMLRMRDKGIQRLNSYGKGDQIVRVNVFVPTKLTSRERNTLKELSKSENIAPSEEQSSEKGSKDFFDKVREVFS